MTKFEASLARMTATIFPASFDAAACFAQAKRCWAIMDTIPCGTEEYWKYFDIAEYWCKQSHQCHEENRKSLHTFDQIFGDFIDESFRRLPKDKKMALIKQSLEK